MTFNLFLGSLIVCHVKPCGGPCGGKGNLDLMTLDTLLMIKLDERNAFPKYHDFISATICGFPSD